MPGGGKVPGGPDSEMYSRDRLLVMTDCFLASVPYLGRQSRTTLAEQLLVVFTFVKILPSLFERPKIAVLLAVIKTSLKYTWIESTAFSRGSETLSQGNL